MKWNSPKTQNLRAGPGVLKDGVLDTVDIVKARRQLVTCCWTRLCFESRGPHTSPVVEFRIAEDFLVAAGSTCWKVLLRRVPPWPSPARSDALPPCEVRRFGGLCSEDA